MGGAEVDVERKKSSLKYSPVGSPHKRSLQCRGVKSLARMNINIKEEEKKSELKCFGFKDLSHRAHNLSVMDCDVLTRAETQRTLHQV